MKLMISSVVVMVAAVLSVGVAAQPRGTMDRTGGWMDGGTGGGAEWLWVVIGVLVAVLLVVVITKMIKTKS
jgi:hypothetical protein